MHCAEGNLPQHPCQSSLQAHLRCVAAAPLRGLDSTRSGQCHIQSSQRGKISDELFLQAHMWSVAAGATLLRGLPGTGSGWSTLGSSLGACRRV